MVYRQRTDELNAALQSLKRKRNIIGTVRLLTLLAAFGGAWLIFPSGWIPALLLLIVCIGIFLRLVAVSANLSQQIRITENMLAVNADELRILKHDFIHRYDGRDLQPANHDYANDLDLFGRASLFQYIQRTTSGQGERTLATWLLSPSSPEEIRKRQAAIKELASKVAWRQEFQAIGMLHRITLKTEDNIAAFVAGATSPYTSAVWKIIRIVVPVIMISFLLLNIAGLLNSGIFWAAVLAAFLFSGFITKRVMPEYLRLDRISGEMEALTLSLARIENINWESDLLRELQQGLRSQTGTASRSIEKFRKILDRLDLRLNPLVFLPLNTFLLWDLQQLFVLEKWKKEQHPVIRQWFSVIGELEALQSFAALHLNQPQWCFPVITTDHGQFESSGLGHPLIPAQKMVINNFTTKGHPHLSLITGSNMAGKSTFLRSIGVNTVLALAGAPVCASSLTVSHMRIMSSMRIADNLEESTSTFYAELKKLKAIIDAVKLREKVFLLLDEILRGTNSLDRHTGSSALIRQLIREEAVAVMATHDLDLATLADSYPGVINNYHFDVQVEGSELFFDYKLKEGICNSLNASILMKKIGIDL